MVFFVNRMESKLRWALERLGLIATATKKAQKIVKCPQKHPRKSHQAVKPIYYTD